MFPGLFPIFFQAIGPKNTAFVLRAMRRLCSPKICSQLLIPSLIRVTHRKPFRQTLEYFSTGVGFGIKAQIDLNDYSQLSAFIGGIPPISLTFLEHATDRSAFIDIGANLGLVSAAVATRLPATSIFAIEANPSTARKLKDLFNRNCPTAFIFNVGFSSTPGSLPMKIVPHDSGSCSFDSARFEGKSNWHNIDFEAQEVPIPVTTFDRWFAENKLVAYSFDRFLIKIDVEGHELQVLKGMHDFLKSSHRALIICEASNANLASARKLLCDSGYSERRPCWNPNLEEQHHHTDVVFGKGI
jgi:FkbM family methyltransferase